MYSDITLAFNCYGLACGHFIFSCVRLVFSFVNFTFSFEISASKKLVSSDLNARMSPNKVAQFDQHRRRIARAVAISRIGDAGNTTLVYFDVRIGVSLSQRNLIPAID